MPTFTKALQSRARGMLVGLAVGDALGAPVEFLPQPQDFYISEMGDKIEHFHNNYRAPKGTWTDDTEMTLCIADSLLENSGYDSYDIMNKFLLWSTQGYRTPDGKPAADVGNQTARAIERFCNNSIILADETKENSAGNGAIMRLAPIVIAAHDSVESAVELSRLSCRETHNSIAAEAVTEMFATSLFYALYGKENDYIAQHFTDQLSKKEYKDFFSDNKYALIGRAKEKDGAMLHNLGGYIVDAFAIAFWGLLNFENFKDGMMAVIRLGGDTDTNAAIYGQLAGAYYGYEAIPEEWREGVYLASELVEIADELLELKSCPVIRTRFEDERCFQENKA
jgi:ADP-ribosyl-[dinitrogen reductase] hydrolase